MSSDIPDSVKAVANIYSQLDTDIDKRYSLGLEYPSDVAEDIGEEDTYTGKILFDSENLIGHFHVTWKETENSEPIIIDKEMQERTSEYPNETDPEIKKIYSEKLESLDEKIDLTHARTRVELLFLIISVISIFSLLAEAYLEMKSIGPFFIIGSMFFIFTLIIPILSVLLGD